MKFSFFVLLILLSNSVFSQKYVLVWNDEFDNPGLIDSTKWAYETGKLRNNELQYYTYHRTENARIEDSVLILEAKKEKYKDADYTSASIISKGIGDWENGKIEISAKVPTGKGTWPALWMMPTYSEYGGWPRSGEIDIMEYIGVEPQSLFYNAHFEGLSGDGHDSNGSGGVQAISNPFTKFIKFTLVWTPEKLEWFADDVKYHEYTKPSNDYRVWPFDKHFYLILNLAYGGNWGGYNGVDDSKLPHKFLIDYVRVYQLQESEGPFEISVKSAKGGSVEISPKMDFYPENTEVTIFAKPDSAYFFKKWTHQSKANPYTFVVRKNTSIVPEFFNASELLSNGTFDMNFRPWTFYISNNQTTEYTSSVIDEKFEIDITKSPNTNWHLGFQELGLSLQKGNYKLSFDAYADNQNSLLITVAKNYSDWSSYISKNINITTENKKYELILNMPIDDNNTRLFFGIGNFLGKFDIDNISLTRIVPTNAKPQFIFYQNDFEIFPNPNNGLFNLEFNSSFNLKNAYLKILTLNGEIVYESFNLNRKNVINTKITQPGFYLIQVISNNKSHTKKIIIK